MFVAFFFLNATDDVGHLKVGIVLQIGRMKVAVGGEVGNNLHGLFHLALIVEVHLYVYAVATDMVEQGAQLVEGHPAGHDALAVVKDLPVEVVPFGTAALRLAHAGCPLYGVQLVNLQQGIQVVHGPHPVEVVEGIVNLLALLADERLHKAAVVVGAYHRRDVALQLRHLSGSP